jgi:cytochrome c-type biogenesis protein CcmH
LIALALILPPLLQTATQPATNDIGARELNISVHKDQLAELEADLRNGIIGKDQYELDRVEIQRRLLDDVAAREVNEVAAKPSSDKQLAYVLAAALPLLAVGLYLTIGNTNARSAAPEPPSPPAASQPSGTMSQSQIEANVAALAKRLEANPSDLQGWIMLARSYSILEQYDESSKAYEKAVALKPRDAELITNYALALAMANGRQFEGKPSELIKQALRIDPENPNVLGLAGGAAFERKNYKEAIVHWDKLLTKIPADSDMAKAVSQRLVEAKSLLSGATEE